MFEPLRPSLLQSQPWETPVSVNFSVMCLLNYAVKYATLLIRLLITLLIMLSLCYAVNYATLLIMLLIPLLSVLLIPLLSMLHC